jgi:WD40 repeat protein
MDLKNNSGYRYPRKKAALHFVDLGLLIAMRKCINWRWFAFLVVSVVHACPQIAIAQSARMMVQLGHEVTAVAFSPNGKFIATGGGDNQARLWVASSGIELRSFQGHSAKITSIAFSPNGRFLLTGSEDQTARLWDLATGIQLRRLDHHSHVFSVAFSANGRFILTGGGRQNGSALEFTLWH